MTKRNTKQTRLRSPRLKQTLLALVSVVLIGGMGLHFLTRSHAAAATTYWLNVSPCGVSGNTYQLCLSATVYNVDPNTTYTITWSGSLDSSVSGTVASLSPTSYTFTITTDASPDVAAAGNTYINSGTYLSLVVTRGCTSVAYTGSSSLGSFNTAPLTGPFGPGCPSESDDQGDDGNDDDGPGGSGDGQGNEGQGNGTRGSGTGSQGSGSGKTGTGTGGGSSGSTATKQGNKPNSTPSSSSQGNKNQTKLDPSPFYDGKQYNRGSESDSSFGGLFNKPTNGGIARGWYLLVGVTLLLSGGGYLWWRKQKPKH